MAEFARSFTGLTVISDLATAGQPHWLLDLLRLWRPSGEDCGEFGLRLAVRDGYLLQRFGTRFAALQPATPFATAQRSDLRYETRPTGPLPHRPIRLRQATISRLEVGEPAVQLRTPDGRSLCPEARTDCPSLHSIERPDRHPSHTSAKIGSAPTGRYNARIRGQGLTSRNDVGFWTGGRT